jgi:hypothetical protein
VRGSIDVIQTDRLRLTPLTVQDADAMVDVLADPELYTFIGGQPPTLEELRERYAANSSAGPRTASTIG